MARGDEPISAFVYRARANPCGMGRLYFMVLLISAAVAATVGGGPDTRVAQSEDRAAPSAAQALETAEPAEQEQASVGEGAIAIPRSSDGHFYADVDINGATIHMLVDTGASGIALSREDAAEAGVAQSIGMTDVIGSGADGDVHGEYVMLDRVALGPKSIEQVPAVILGSGPQSLLGQSFLRRFGSVEIAGDTMRLQ
jgi:aspartyl protease family protein